MFFSKPYILQYVDQCNIRFVHLVGHLDNTFSYYIFAINDKKRVLNVVDSYLC